MSVRRARPVERALCFAVRERVFVREQHVPATLEWDDLDDRAIHWVAVVGGRPIGTVRLVVRGGTGRLGRLAVVPRWRGAGVGRRLVSSVHRAARRRGLRRVVLSSQVAAVPFYERFGYMAFGPVFDDAGIPHREMALDLSGESSRRARLTPSRTPG